MGPVIQSMIQKIELEYVQNVLVAADGLDYWLARCRTLDPTCNSTFDIAALQWGYFAYDPDWLGVNQTDVK